MKGAVSDVRFCHLVIGVTDMDRALGFYRGLLGMEVVFETLISGEPFDAVLHATRKQEGRVVGGLLGGLMVELLSDGTPVEFIELPRGARGTYEMHRGVPLQLGPAR